MLNRAEEDYIKTIYELTIQDEEQMIKTNEISEFFGYTDQSVNEMVKKLSSKGFLKFVPYKGVSLTKKGQLEAIRLIRAHRIWEVFLTDKLNLSWEEVHEDAENLEHATSKLVIDKLYEYLDQPKFCQHGNPIPDAFGHTVKRDETKLIDVQKNMRFKLLRVTDQKALLLFLNKENIKLNDIIEVVDKDDFNQIIQILHQQKKTYLSYKIARLLFGIILDE